MPKCTGARVCAVLCGVAVAMTLPIAIGQAWNGLIPARRSASDGGGSSNGGSNPSKKFVMSKNLFFKRLNQQLVQQGISLQQLLQRQLNQQPNRDWLVVRQPIQQQFDVFAESLPNPRVRRPNSMRPRPLRPRVWRRSVFRDDLDPQHMLRTRPPVPLQLDPVARSERRTRSVGGSRPQRDQEEDKEPITVDPRQGHYEYQKMNPLDTYKDIKSALLRKQTLDAFKEKEEKERQYQDDVSRFRPYATTFDDYFGSRRRRRRDKNFSSRRRRRELNM